MSPRTVILATLLKIYASNIKGSINIRNESTFYDGEFRNVSTTISSILEYGEEINISESGFGELCEMFNITRNECSCEIYPQLCIPLRATPATKTNNCTTKIDFILGIIMLTNAILGLIGNGVVLLVTWYSHREMKQFRKLVAYLALCDFTFAALQVMRSIRLLWTCQWIYGGFMCRLLVPSATFGEMMSLGIIIMISVERYYGIVKPFTKNHLITKLWPSMLINVIICFLFGIPMLIILRIDVTGHCMTDWKDMRKGLIIYNWFLLIAAFIIPFCVVSILNTKIIRFLYTQVATSSGVLNMNEQQRHQRLKGNKRVLKILATILVAYFILVLPNRLGWVILYMAGCLSNKRFHAIKFLILIPYQFHVAINPLIYSVIDKKFRKDFLAIVNKVKKQKDNKSQ